MKDRSEFSRCRTLARHCRLGRPRSFSPELVRLFSGRAEGGVCSKNPT